MAATNNTAPPVGIVAPVEAARSTEFPDVVEQAGVVCSRATGPLGRCLARRLGLHDDGCQTARLVIEALVPRDPLSPTRWTRTFGDRSWSTIVSIEPDATITERLGVFGLRFAAELEADRMRLTLVGVGLGSRSRVWRLLPLSVSVDIAPLGQYTATTVEARLINGLGRLRYVAYMTEQPDGGRER